MAIVSALAVAFDRHALPASVQAPQAASGRQDLCADLREVDVVELIISIIILIGMLISYLPQHVRIISRRTSEGISPWFVCLGTTSATSAFANILLLPKSRQDVACCGELEAFRCVAGLLGIAQLGMQWACFFVIFILFLMFFNYKPRAATATAPEGAGHTGDGQTPVVANVAAEEDAEEEEETVDTTQIPGWQTALLVAAITVVHGLFVVLGTGILAITSAQALPTWAEFLGVTAAVLAGVQYLPQIYTTFHLKHVGSLSIPMMLIQTPGGFLFAASLFMRLGWAGWSSWGIFLLTATMQGILLSMAIYYQIREHGGFPWGQGAAYTGRKHGGDGGSHGAGANGDGDTEARAPLIHVHPDGFDDDTAGTYSNHPEIYAATPEQLGDILQRQEADAADDRRPLLLSERNADTDYGTNSYSGRT